MNHPISEVAPRSQPSLLHVGPVVVQIWEHHVFATILGKELIFPPTARKVFGTLVRRWPDEASLTELEEEIGNVPRRVRNAVGEINVVLKSAFETATWRYKRRVASIAGQEKTVRAYILIANTE
jgi:hypothetical protein